MVVSNRRKQETRQAKACLVYKSVLKASTNKIQTYLGKFITPMRARSVKESACSSIRVQFITHKPLHPVSSQAKHAQSSNIMNLIKQLCTCFIWLGHAKYPSLCARVLASWLFRLAAHSYQQFHLSYKGIMLNTWAAPLFSFHWLSRLGHRVVLLMPTALMKWAHNIIAPPNHLEGRSYQLLIPVPALHKIHQGTGTASKTSLPEQPVSIYKISTATQLWPVFPNSTHTFELCIDATIPDV